MNNVIKNYFKNILIVGILLFVLKFLVDYLADVFTFLLSAKIRLIIFFVGTWMLLVATIGRLGWHIQTWDGNSPAESLDKILFWLFAVVGTAFIIADYFLVLKNTN
jgi:hypothetical protein